MIADEVVRKVIKSLFRQDKAVKVLVRIINVQLHRNEQIEETAEIALEALIDNIIGRNP